MLRILIRVEANANGQSLDDLYEVAAGVFGGQEAEERADGAGISATAASYVRPKAST
jgi:hypothetical protein